MNHSAILQWLLYVGVRLALAWPLGLYLQRLLSGGLSLRFAWMGRSESALLKCMGSSADEDMPWWRYAQAILVFNVVGLLAVYLLQRMQVWLPLNPAELGAVSADSAFNTAVSFVANTNWQGYAGETTMSVLTQMLALTVQNFLSAATGIAVLLALIRGFMRHQGQGLGNAWLDLSCCTLWLLMPLAFVSALFLVSQGVVQTFESSVAVPLLESAGQQQTLALGPVASQEAIKQLGTNGGGFFNANSSHPFENPTPVSNVAQMLAIFLLPCALVFMFGRMLGDRRHGWVILAAMLTLFGLAFAALYWAESHANPLITTLGVDAGQGNMEGKELRFGVLGSSLFATITTAASCGAVNAMHDSLMPLTGGVTMWLMQLGEVVFGGVGSGLYGMVLFAILAVFLCGLMIGRTPEYLGKKIGSFEMKMVSIAILIGPFWVLTGTALSVMTEAGRVGILNPGSHGFSEVLYAFSSAANNNGSAFAGLSANTPFYNVMLGLAMWVGALTYVPALALGPVVEHLQLFSVPR